MNSTMALALVVVTLCPAYLHASSAKPAMEVVVLGSGGPRAFGRAGSSYILVLDGKPRILVDAGPGAFLRIGELNLDLAAVDTVLLTHLHIDHSGDLPAFFNDRALTSDGPITYRIFGPDGAGLFPKTSRFVDLLVGNDGAFAYQKTFGSPESFTVRDLAISLNSPLTKIVDDHGLVVEEIATHHGDCPSVAYRITYRLDCGFLRRHGSHRRCRISCNWRRVRICWFLIAPYWTRPVRHRSYTICTRRPRKSAKPRAPAG